MSTAASACADSIARCKGVFPGKRVSTANLGRARGKGERTHAVACIQSRLLLARVLRWVEEERDKACRASGRCAVSSSVTDVSARATRPSESDARTYSGSWFALSRAFICDHVSLSRQMNAIVKGIHPRLSGSDNDRSGIVERMMLDEMKHEGTAHTSTLDFDAA